jgi:hypothetical protein
MSPAKSGRAGPKPRTARTPAADPVAMGVDEARALAMAYELQVLLYSITEHREDERVEAALDLVDDVIGELESFGPDHGKQCAHSLRLLVTDTDGYEEHRTKQALRSLASTPWRRS